jgi:nucleotide-binding universal stress UspA family protein
LTAANEAGLHEGRPIMTSAIHGILVGYDGSPDSKTALRWAAREARWRGTALTVCHACPPGDVEAPSGDRAPDQMQPADDQQVAAALRFARTIMGPCGARLFDLAWPWAVLRAGIIAE